MNTADDTRAETTSGEPPRAPRWFLTAMKFLMAAAVVGCVIGALDSLTTVWYYGGTRTCSGELQIIDAETGEPVPRAAVRVLGRHASSFEADESGVVVLPVRYQTGRTTKLFREHRAFVVDDIKIEVAKESYRTSEELISFQREKVQREVDVRMRQVAVSLHPLEPASNVRQGER